LIHLGLISYGILAALALENGKQEAGEEKQGRKSWTLREVGGKPVWDWLDLLLVPLILGIVAVGLTAWFNWQQGERQNDIENRRAQAEWELAEQRAQDEALQTYLDQMSTLLLEQNLSDDKVRTLLRARTLTVLERLDPSRKAQVMRFLLEADLVQSADERVPIIALAGGNLRGSNLRAADLREVDLYSANLSAANLSDSTLRWADLSNADLSPDAELRDADLSHTYLLFADLRGANLSGANLSDAQLRKADLRAANLQGARGVTNDELEQQAASLKGATMPNGQKYEDWLKDRENRKENGENK
jgi:uncharacterized protein YjbI with pentapeptide repeats